MCRCNGGGGRQRAAAPAVNVPAPTGARSLTTVEPTPVVAPPPPRPSARTARHIRRFGGGEVPQPAPIPAPAPAPSFHIPIVDTKVWGSHLWTVLHVTSLAVSCGDVWPRLIEELKMGIPCPDCTGHYTAWAVSQPVTAATDMPSWFLTLHNDVNRRISTPVFVRKGWTCDQLASAYTGRFNDARAALDAINGIIGTDAWTTLDAILRVAMTPPVTEVQQPVTTEQPPVTEEQPPVTEEQPPVTEEQQPVTDEQPPVTEV
jgi:hypothetical protein